MPVYEYECKSCGTRFEKVQPITADPITECVNCGQGPIRRIFHPVGVIFKGSGWYITDSRKSASASAPGSDKSSSAKSDDSKDSKPSSESNDDSKPSGDSNSADSTTTKATVADSSPAD